MENSVLKEVKVNFREAIRRRVGMRFLESVLTAIESDKELAGFVMVTWDNRGIPQTAYWTGDGPIGEGMMPSYVREVLTRRMATDHTVEIISGEGRTPDEPA